MNKSMRFLSHRKQFLFFLTQRPVKKIYCSAVAWCLGPFRRLLCINLASEKRFSFHCNCMERIVCIISGIFLRIVTNSRENLLKKPFMFLRALLCTLDKGKAIFFWRNNQKFPFYRSNFIVNQNNCKYVFKLDLWLLLWKLHKWSGFFWMAYIVLIRIDVKFLSNIWGLWAWHIMQNVCRWVFYYSSRYQLNVSLSWNERLSEEPDLFLMLQRQTVL